MLEQPALLLRPCAAGDHPAPRRVGIIDPITEVALGFASRRRARGRLAWLRAWGPPVIEVHESDDEPLLFTMRRGWGFGRRWRVEDAEGTSVGRVVGPFLLDRRERPLAHFRRSEAGTASYKDVHGREIAATAAGDEGVRLTFRPDGEGNPFVKMLLLAATLIHNETALGGL
jgi:hypothetical protein